MDGQVELLEEILAQKPQAVVIAPINDDRVTERLQKIQEAKIPLVIIDTPVKLGSARLSCPTTTPPRAFRREK